MVPPNPRYIEADLGVVDYLDRDSRAADFGPASTSAHQIRCVERLFIFFYFCSNMSFDFIFDFLPFTLFLNFSSTPTSFPLPSGETLGLSTSLFVQRHRNRCCAFSFWSSCSSIGGSIRLANASARPAYVLRTLSAMLSALRSYGPSSHGTSNMAF